MRGRSPRGVRGSTAVRRVRADCAHVRPAASCSAVAGTVTTAATAQGTSEARGTIEAVACTTGIDHQTPQTADEEPRTDGALRSSQSALRSSQSALRSSHEVPREGKYSPSLRAGARVAVAALELRSREVECGGRGAGGTLELVETTLEFASGGNSTLLATQSRLWSRPNSTLS